MQFTVTWLPDVEQELAELWLKSSDRRALSEAADAVDKQLRVDPHNVGESRSGGRRIVVVPPLVVVF